ncbi:MAG TPA: DUF3526 domain-containing protein [Lacunisphaera sp.]|nr:DUF3526 domain-containing protein [Lacunisphaera sp.]
MKAFLRLLLWEARHLQRSGPAWLVCGGLLAASLLATWAGGRNLARHRGEVAALAAQYATQMETITREFSPQGEAGYVAYYTFIPTHWPMSPLAALTTGVRDVVPSVIWVRMLGLEGQLYEADLGNPALQALGGLDLAFVFCALAPLALLVLGHDAFTRDRDLGRFTLVAAQAGGLGRLLAARIGARALLVVGTVTLAFAGACAWLHVSPDGRAARWLLAVWAYLACWTSLAACIAVVARSVAGSLALALTTWVASVILVPALLNLALTAAFPVPEGLALTVHQRQESHAAWDRPRAETMEKFFVHHPEWAGTPPVEGRFAWRWYYAMQEMGDQSVAAQSQAYRHNLRSRQAVMTRLAWLAPVAYAQLALSARAGTDLDAHLDYLDRVRAFHGELRRRFYPLFFAEASITPAQFDLFPPFPAEPPAAAAPSGPSLWPLLAIGALAFGATRLLLRRRFL